MSREKNPIPFNAKLVSDYLEAANSGKTFEEFAKSQKISVEQFKFLKNHINQIRQLCKENDRKFLKLKSSRLAKDEKDSLIRLLFPEN